MPETIKARMERIIALLREHYPESRTALDFSTPLQILVATILAAQCTDERVNRITPGLFRKYPTAASLARADRSELEAIIRSAGFFRMKAGNIIGAAERITSEYGGKVPDTMKELLTLPGVARKTANIVLSAAFGKAEGIAVDTHVGRLSGRLGLSSETDPVKIEKDLLTIVPRGDWLDFNYMMVDHGRAVCQARKPRCAECFLAELCPWAGKAGAAPEKK